LALNRAAKTCIGLGLASLVAVLVGHLALTDIYHGEGDLSQEWSALRVCAGVIVAFQVYALITLSRVVRGAHGGGGSARAER
jgi:hypothetical protein